MNRFHNTRFMSAALCALLLGFAASASARSIEMEVNGLVCAFCAQGIQKSIRKFPAAHDVFVSLENRLVAVQLVDGQDIADADLTAAVTGAGYTTVQIERSEATLDEIRARVGKKSDGAGD